jgi:hypothetical protein
MGALIGNQGGSVALGPIIFAAVAGVASIEGEA